MSGPTKAARTRHGSFDEANPESSARDASGVGLKGPGFGNRLLVGKPGFEDLNRQPGRPASACLPSGLQAHTLTGILLLSR